MSKKLTNLNYTNRLFKTLPEIFALIKATPLKNPRLIHLNEELLKELELDFESCKTPSFLRFLNGDLEFDGLFYGASVYSGHQFGYYVPQLGDGRAVYLCEIKTDKNNFYELQLKGSGFTPFSRMGDGKAVYRSSVREYLASIHMEALGIPTTKALSIIKGDDQVRREEIEPSAIVLRVAESFIRFGHFEFLTANNHKDELKKLMDFCIDNFFTEYKDHPNKYVLYFQDIVKKTAKLFANWQAVGFTHGVLNTDNTSILGLTLDYGPYGFISNFDQDYIPNHSDHQGRYSLGNQPGIGMWNLSKLVGSFEVFADKDNLQKILDTYPAIFLYEYRRILLEKLGLFKIDLSDEEMIKSMLNMLVETEIDYTNFFRALSTYKKGSLVLDNIKDHDSLTEWLVIYDRRLNIEEISENDRHIFMLSKNPKYILRNYIAQKAIEDETFLNSIYHVLKDPFSEWPEFEEFTKPPTSEQKKFIISCSS